MAKKKSLKVSIIVPVYNADLYLDECLNSLVNQTLQDIEIICVNDNSQDKSLKILQKFAKKDSRIKIVSFEETRGQSRARNVALELVSGEYVGFVDADDFVDLDMFEKMYNKAQKSDIVMCQAKVFDDKVKNYKDDEYFALDCFDDKFVQKPFNHEHTKSFITDINVSVWNKIYRSEFLKNSGVKFQEGFIYEDLPYFYEIYTQAEKVVLLKEFLYTYRINNKNSTMTKTDKNVKDRIDMASRAYDVLKRQKYFSQIKVNVINSIIHDIFYRFLIIDNRYQKEYFFRMQKFFRTIDTTDIDDTLIKSPYYPSFCEIKKRNYDEIIKYFCNQETLGAAYVEHAKIIFDREFKKLEQQKSDFAAEKERHSDEIEQERLNCEIEKAENLKEKEALTQSKNDVDKLWKDFELQKSAKLAELDKLQAKILQDEKNRWAEFERQKQETAKDNELQSVDLQHQWENFEKEKQNQSREIEQQWKDFEKEKQIQYQEIERQWKTFEGEKEAQKKEIGQQWANFNKEKEEKFAEIDKAWEEFKKSTAEKEANLSQLQDKILQDEKDRWKLFEEETAKKQSELKQKEEDLTQKFTQKEQDLYKLEDELWQKINSREEALKQAEYELEKAWEKFKIDNLTREKELDKKQAEILSDEKDRWKEYELKVADFERQKEEKAKENELQTLDLEHQWKDFEKEKEIQYKEIEKQWQTFEKEKEIQIAELKAKWTEFENAKTQKEQELKQKEDELNQEFAQKESALNQEIIQKEKILLLENDRKKKKDKLAVEKAKKILANKNLEEIAKEKVKLAEETALENKKQREYYSEMLKKQMEIQEENYRKTDIFKKKIKDEIMQRPKVSIILPVYNVAPYLRQSLDSIIAQTIKDIEIICVDDGSTDESGKILDEYKEKDSRIKVIHKKNAGTGAARNDGLRIATGECIGFVDPDDWILPNMYERLYGLLQEKDLDIVMFTPDVFNDQTQKHEGFLYFQDSNFPKFLDDKIFNKDDISPFSYPMCVWNKLYRKKLFDENKIDFAEGLDFEDHKVIFKSLFTAKRIYFIREKLYVYRHSRQGSILSDNDTRMFDHIKIYDIVENILKETGNWEKFHLDFLRYKVHNILYYYTMIKPQYKEEYYKKMVKSLQSTQMNQEEFETLAKDYPDLKPIMEDTLTNKIKRAVKKIIKR